MNAYRLRLLALVACISLLSIACKQPEKNDTEQPVKSLSSEEKKNAPHESLAQEVEDYWFEQKGAFIKQISYLPNFDSKNVDHWRALLAFGYANSYPASQLGKSRLIFFTNSPVVEKQDNFEMLTEHNRSIVIGMYQILPNGKPLFTPNPFGLIDPSYFLILDENKTFINAHHFNALQ